MTAARCEECQLASETSLAYFRWCCNVNIMRDTLKLKEEGWYLRLGQASICEWHSESEYRAAKQIKNNVKTNQVAQHQQECF